MRIANVIAFAIYIAGIVISKGFWSVFFAIIFPPYSWYVVIEHLITKL